MDNNLDEECSREIRTNISPKFMWNYEEPYKRNKMKKNIQI